MSIWPSKSTAVMAVGLIGGAVALGMTRTPLALQEYVPVTDAQISSMPRLPMTANIVDMAPRAPKFVPLAKVIPIQIEVESPAECVAVARQHKNSLTQCFGDGTVPVKIRTGEIPEFAQPRVLASWLHPKQP